MKKQNLDQAIEQTKDKLKDQVIGSIHFQPRINSGLGPGAVLG